MGPFSHCRPWFSRHFRPHSATANLPIARIALPIITDSRTSELAAQLREGCPVAEQVADRTEDVNEEPEKEAPLSNGETKGNGQVHRSTRHTPPATHSGPLSNGKTKKARKGKKQRKTAKALCLQPEDLKRSAGRAPSRRAVVGICQSEWRRQSSQRVTNSSLVASFVISRKCRFSSRRFDWKMPTT
jgi:hypothetical protein